MRNKTLVLSIALNGYQWVYKKELKSHGQYAHKHDYEYQAVTRPFVSLLGVECCWLKLTLIRTALLSGYDTVLFLDADARVNPNCPPLINIFQKNKYIYMAKGYSKRFNSGVLIARNNVQTIEWLTCVINARVNKVQKENDVGWGENGHVIELSKGINFISELDQKWNNTFDYQLNDYIRHHNYGPMRTSVFNNFFHKVVFFLSSKLLTFTHKDSLKPDKKSQENLLTHETHKILSIYPKLATS
jgi:hypothetical protein